MSSRVWTAEQEELFALSSEGKLKLPRVAVSADAGAGKTSVLVERVRVFRKAGLETGRRILCVSFTEKSKADLEERLSEYPECDVHTIHGFCLRVVGEFGSKLGLPPILRIFDSEADQSLLKDCFERVYRRAPIRSLQRSSREYLALCQAAAVADQGHAAILIEDPDLSEVPTFVKEVLEGYEHAKTVRGAVTYADMERLALELLRQSEVSALLRARYAHVFIDEFQDTSRTQCEIAERLSARGTPLFVVGDRKQSIYRFRGADVSVFLEFASKLENQRSLTANFRSHLEVIRAINAVCGKALPDYFDMTAGRDEREPMPGLRGPQTRVHRARADSIVEGLLGCLDDVKRRGISLSDTVLLLQRMNGAGKIFAALKQAGIPFATTSASTTAMHEGVRNLLNLWIFACEPWRKATAFETVVALGLSNRSDLAQGLQQLRLLQEETWRPVCSELLEELDRKFSLQSRFGVLFEQFTVFVLRHQEQGMGPSELAGRFTEMLEEGPFGQMRGEGFSEFFLLPPPPELSSTLRVMTVHGSKGLEFPVVILGDAGARPTSRRQAILMDGERVYLAGKDEKGASQYFPEMQKAFERKWASEAEEKGRLLYVAMTRAREALYVVDETVESAEKAAKKQSKLPAWPDWIEKSGLPVEYLEAGSGLEPQGSAHNAAIPMHTPLEVQAPVLKRARHGVTELIEARKEGLERAISERSREALNRRESAALGTAVHECLERMDWGRLGELAHEEGLDLSKFEIWRESEEARRVFGPHAEIRRNESEFAFEWKSTHGFVTGRIDRLVAFAGDETWIIDYKIVRAKTDLLAEYRAQLEIYRDAIRDLTGAPRVRVFLLDVLGRNSSGNQLLMELL